MILPIEALQKALAYNPETGELTWKYRDDRSKQWNTRWAGKTAGTTRDTGCQVLPYIRRTLSLDGKQLRAHRVAWAIHYGSWPAGELDHINGNPSDNRITNLRLVSRVDNARNQQVRSNNKTGVTGVHFDTQTSSWAASIMLIGKNKRLGRHKSFFDAVCARKSAERTYGFHANHGRN